MALFSNSQIKNFEMDRPPVIDSVYVRKHRCGTRKISLNVISSLSVSHWDSESSSLNPRKILLHSAIAGVSEVKQGTCQPQHLPCREYLGNLSTLSLYCFVFSFPLHQHTGKTIVPVSAYSIRCLWLHCSFEKWFV